MKENIFSPTYYFVYIIFNGELIDEEACDNEGNRQSIEN